LDATSDGGLASADVWSDPERLSGRAHFRPETFPALLRVHDARAADAGLYRCRVDFTHSATRNELINLTVVVPPRPVAVYDATDGQRRTTFVGPYVEGAPMALVCLAFNGE